MLKGLSWTARIYIWATIISGLGVLVLGAACWESLNTGRFVCYLLLAATASMLKVHLPGVEGTMSVNFLFILIGLVELQLPETLIIGCTGTLVQCTWKTRSPVKPVQTMFSMASMALAVGASYLVYQSRLWPSGWLSLRLALGACTFFFANTFPVATAIALTERKSLLRIWKECYFWSFPYYLIGAAVAALVAAVNRFAGWSTSTLILPVIYWMYRSYHQYLGRLEAEKRHVEEVAGLHLRTIEALALAIEAKDFNTNDHLRRVGVYALEIGKELGLSEPELKAVQTAALLHDIGKLAVPEHIISKPGRLTPAEFEKMKIHPIVGAEILARVEFPYPVAPIVRAHHEKWDGAGYPAGLKGEEIPIGARILAAVDCLDALASDRPYRRALPLEDALARVRAEAGQSFDPRVVEVLSRRCQDLECKVNARPLETPRLSKTVRVERGAAPAAGFENHGKVDAASENEFDFLSSIAAAREEAQTLFELTKELGNSLGLIETLSVLALRLKRMIPFDTIAVYVRRDNRLAPEFVSGENFRLFSALEIPLGEGLSGWVAETRKPILNGNPSVEPGYLDDPERFSTLRSALAVPLDGLGGVVGVLAMYHSERDFFTKDHLRILQAISEKVALSIENALKYRQAENNATTDALTDLPNARSLFLHLDRELSRSKRQDSPLCVLVCDLDGFKEVNDRFGHLEGNKVLRAVADGLRQQSREYDYVARMGGDEFVIVLPASEPEAVAAKVSRLQGVASEAGRRICGYNLLSMSVGAAAYPQDGSDAEQLLAEADRRMYKAKHTRKGTAGLWAWDLRPATAAVQ